MLAQLNSILALQLSPPHSPGHILKQFPKHLLPFPSIQLASSSWVTSLITIMVQNIPILTVVCFHLWFRIQLSKVEKVKKMLKDAGVAEIWIARCSVGKAERPTPFQFIFQYLVISRREERVQWTIKWQHYMQKNH